MEYYLFCFQSITIIFISWVFISTKNCLEQSRPIEQVRPKATTSTGSISNTSINMYLESYPFTTGATSTGVVEVTSKYVCNTKKIILFQKTFNISKYHKSTPFLFYLLLYTCQIKYLVSK